ncbi:snare binding protein [Dioszegia hungarica]|uniref:DNA damage-inducible protein 1 n=1 Tax=Dioszegia hungarica TaxID=4972 RepID=A0AA38LT43_9TREE|nr:snare binding protein [Dioszegia hungarica]KAI9634425.1 snare binding protein [Dioszegia hungarica]
MRLIIIGDESVYEHEVDPSMEVQDVIALIEAETGLSADQVLLSTDTGTPLISSNKSLESYGLKGGDATIYLTVGPRASSSQLPRGGGGPVNEDAEYERMRLQMLGDPAIMSQVQRELPDLHRAIQAGGAQFKAAVLAQRSQVQDSAAEKERQIELLNSDPYDIEAQKKIEEAIRRERVLENMEHAWDYAPETFANVTMLYINVEVNGHKVKAFVDSGAQRTISEIMRLLDERFAGVAVGVGTGKILGRVHSAQIKLGELHLPCSFTVLEGKSVELLFGLDMLKRYQCSIDLAANVLRIQQTEVPFLPDHELPQDGLQQEIQAAQDEAEVKSGPSQASGSGSGSAAAGPSSASGSQFPGSGNVIGSTPSAVAASGFGGAAQGGAPRAPVGAQDAARAGKVQEDDVQTLMGLGAERQQAISLLEAAGGNVDYAASMLFGGGGGGAQWP